LTTLVAVKAFESQLVLVKCRCSIVDSVILVNYNYNYNYN